MANKLYTLGYKDWSFYDFLDKVKELEVMVIDVRFVPKAYVAFWDTAHLGKTLKENYMHVPALGNRNYNDSSKPIQISNMEMGADIVIEEMNSGKDCLLLCACSDVNECHRKVVSEYIQKKTDCEIIDL